MSNEKPDPDPYDRVFDELRRLAKVPPPPTNRDLPAVLRVACMALMDTTPETARPMAMTVMAGLVAVIAEADRAEADRRGPDLAPPEGRATK